MEIYWVCFALNGQVCYHLVRKSHREALVRLLRACDHHVTDETFWLFDQHEHSYVADRIIQSSIVRKCQSWHLQQVEPVTTLAFFLEDEQVECLRQLYPDGVISLPKLTKWFFKLLSAPDREYLSSLRWNIPIIKFDTPQTLEAFITTVRAGIREDQMRPHPTAPILEYAVVRKNDFVCVSVRFGPLPKLPLGMDCRTWIDKVCGRITS